MEVIQGIYKISNTINSKIYVGQSVHIYRRWTAHLRSAMGGKADSNNLLHTAMREIGVENFRLEILEVVSDAKKLNEREIFWIEKLKSREEGYNFAKGGSGVIGENNPRAILTEDDVIVIRSMYGDRVPFREVYKLYEGIISKRGFQKVWHYETWLKIMPEVYTDENKEWHATAAKGFMQPKLSDKQKKLSEEEVLKIKQLYSEGVPFRKIAKETGRSESTVRKYALGLNSEKTSSGISVKNIETGRIFESFVDAALWANCNRKGISDFVNGKTKRKFVGHVPTTGEPATWTLDL